MGLSEIYDYFNYRYNDPDFGQIIANFIDSAAVWATSGAKVKVKYRFATKIKDLSFIYNKRHTDKEQLDKWKEAYKIFLELLSQGD